MAENKKRVVSWDLLLTFMLGIGRTRKEMEKKFPGSSSREIMGLVKRQHNEYRLVEQTVANGETHFLFLPSSGRRPRRQRRIWTHELNTPYILIKMPDSDYEFLNIIPLGDANIGNTQHDKDRFGKYIEWLRRTPNAFCFLNGDIFEKFLAGKKGGAELAIITDKVCNLLGRISHKILWAQPGDNEEANLSRHGYDGLEALCTEFGIPYIRQPVYADILWREKLFTFFCIHGCSSAITEGGKINAALRPAAFLGYTHYIVMGHIKDSMADTLVKFIRNPAENVIGERISYIMICPSFLNYLGSRAAKKGHNPFSYGAISCRLYRDGSHSISK